MHPTRTNPDPPCRMRRGEYSTADRGEVGLNELALFAGAGGGLLGTRLLGWKTVCYVERDPYCIEILKARISEGCLDDSPIWDDVRTFDGRAWRGVVDVVSAGFPCQPFSSAGRRRAGGDSRNMWPDTIRIIREVRPTWALLENVTGLLHGTHGYFGRVLQDLAQSGYYAQWGCLPASALGAPHRRDRLWIVGYALRHDGESLPRPAAKDRDLGEKQLLTTPATWLGVRADWSREVFRASDELPPRLCRVDDGLAHRVDRLRAIGNGQVPAVVRAIWSRLTNAVTDQAEEIKAA